MLNFNSFKAYERGKIVNTECFEKKEQYKNAHKHNRTSTRVRYGVRVQYGLNTDTMMFYLHDAKAERDALYQLLSGQ